MWCVMISMRPVYREMIARRAHRNVADRGLTLSIVQIAGYASIDQPQLTMAKGKSVRIDGGGGGDAFGSSLPRLLRWPVRTARGLLFSHSYFPTCFALVLLAEFALGCAIIQKVACQ
jgi:hypothetical protein